MIKRAIHPGMFGPGIIQSSLPVLSVALVSAFLFDSVDVEIIRLEKERIRFRGNARMGTGDAGVSPGFAIT